MSKETNSDEWRHRVIPNVSKAGQAVKIVKFRLYFKLIIYPMVEKVENVQSRLFVFFHSHLDDFYSSKFVSFYIFLNCRPWPWVLYKISRDVLAGNSKKTALKLDTAIATVTDVYFGFF